MTTQLSYSGPKIYVACLAAYNNGKLHGEWIDATQDIEDINNEIQAMLKESPERDAEEYAIHDYDEFYCSSLGEYESLETISKLGNLILEHGQVAAKLYDHWHQDIAMVEDALENCDQGEWKSKEDFGYDVFEDIYANEVPDYVKLYIDYDKFSQDIFINDDYYSIDLGYEKVHIFRRCD